ncbi:GMC oxidoreductase [Azospirillum sp. sgz301742]
MFIDLRGLDNGPTLDADICIIGGGPAGIVMALEFAGASKSVIVIESGGLDLDAETQDLTAGPNVGLPYYPLETVRLRLLGGNTNHWQNWCGELDPIDFRVRDWVPDSGWPIGAEELAPYITRARPMCGLVPDLPDEEIWRQLKIEPLKFDPAHLTTSFVQFAGPTNFGHKYEQSLRNAQNIRVLLFANATNIQTDEAASNVEHVAVSSLTGRKATVKARTFVLACGGIENARLLLSSDTVEPNGLGNRHDLVGRYFMEHIEAPVGTVLTENPYQLLAMLGSTWVGEHGYVPFLQLSEEVQVRKGLLNSCLMLGLEESSRSAVATLKSFARSARKGQMPDDLGRGLLTIIRDVDMVAYNTYRRRLLGLQVLPKLEDLKRIYLLSQTEQAPNPDSRVVLADERDALGMRRTALDWRLTELDRRTLIEHAKVVGTEIARVGVGLFRLEDWLEQAPGTWSKELAGHYHHMGTTRMAVDERKGVVDTDCKVHNVNNLYVAGSSVFPTGGYINPTLTLLALSLRLADRLKASI